MTAVAISTQEDTCQHIVSHGGQVLEGVHYRNDEVIVPLNLGEHLQEMGNTIKFWCTQYRSLMLTTSSVHMYSYTCWQVHQRFGHM